MKFIVQHNLINPDQLDKISGAIKKFPHEYVGVVPFSREITSDQPLVGKDFIPYGSTLMTTLASDLGWTGLHFDLDRMNYGCFLRNRTDMLNDNLFYVQEGIQYLRSFDADREFFTRPSEDLKHYAGQVIKAGELADWLQSMIDVGEGSGTYYLPPDKQVVICEPKTIQAEWRWFIVGGQAVSGSMYRAHGQFRSVRETDAAVTTEAQLLANKWLPHECVVMDTALVNDEMHVIEFNCINASGMYDNDVDAVFGSLWDYHN